MRKKFFTTAIMIIFTIICCCSCTKDPQSFSDEYFTYENLFREYAEGNWKGEFISSDNHCARADKDIRMFYIDNESYFMNFDDESMPIGIWDYSMDYSLEEEFRSWKHRSEKGTYYYNENDMSIELWKLGEIIQTWSLPDEYSEKGSLIFHIKDDKKKNAILYSDIYPDMNLILKDNGKIKEAKKNDIKYETRRSKSNKKKKHPNVEKPERYTKYDDILNSDWNGEFTKTKGGDFISSAGPYLKVNCEYKLFLDYEYPILLSDWRERVASGTAGIYYTNSDLDYDYWIIVEDEAKNLHKQIWRDGEIMEDSPISPEEIYD